jgi:hypothetical protein
VVRRAATSTPAHVCHPLLPISSRQKCDKNVMIPVYFVMVSCVPGVTFLLPSYNCVRQIHFSLSSCE